MLVAGIAVGGAVAAVSTFGPGTANAAVQADNAPPGGRSVPLPAPESPNPAMSADQATSPSGAPNAGATQGSGMSGDAGSGSRPPAQLAASQLPAVGSEEWKPTGRPSVRAVNGHDVGENECAKIDAASTWTQQAFLGGAGQNVAIQDTFAFSSPTAAQSAYQAFAAGMADCQVTTRALQTSNKVTADAVVTRTAIRTGGQAWARTWTGVMGQSAAGAQTNHYYLAVHGARVIVLCFTEFPGQAAPYDTAADPRVLAMLETELAR